METVLLYSLSSTSLVAGPDILPWRLSVLTSREMSSAPYFLMKEFLLFFFDEDDFLFFFLYIIFVIWESDKLVIFWIYFLTTPLSFFFKDRYLNLINTVSIHLYFSFLEGNPSLGHHLHKKHCHSLYILPQIHIPE